MHINCNKEELAYGVQLVSRAVSTKNTLPILGGIMLEAKDNRLTLKATDLEIAIQYSLDTEVLENGVVVVPGKYFSEMVKRLPAGIINICKNNNSIDMKYEQSEISINCYEAEEFPIFPELDENIFGNMDQDLFKRMVRQISIATSNDLTRPVFTGIFFEVSDNQLILVATDTHRLALRRGVWKDNNLDKISLIVPNRTMVEVARIIGDESEPLKISLSNTQISFTAGNLTIISRLIEGQYPNYNSVIPDRSKCKSIIRVRTKKLLETAERASLLVREELKERFSLITLNAQNNILKISSNSPEIGKIYEEIEIYFEGEPLEIVFNSRYLIDALKVIDSEEIIFELTGPLSPGIIKTVESEEYLYLILPVRTV